MDPTARLPLLAALLTIAMLASACGEDDPSRDRVVARAPSSAALAGPSTTPVNHGSAAGLLVDVAGHVRRPGVYRLAVGARVHEAIAAAGGARPGADLASLNRAAPVVDGQQVLVGSVRSGGSTPRSTGAASVSINAADAAALDGLPGIGPVTAARIVEARTASGPFASVDDLDRVPGIGPATIETLREHATT